MAAIIVAYALSSIDLIPDFIPVLGYLDDFLLLPFGILLVIRMIPAHLMAEFRAEAMGMAKRLCSLMRKALIVGLWLSCGGLLVWLAWPFVTIYL